ncbi:MULTISPECIES: universal stress protein [Methanobacterium]|jgi:nucleotide-binding universal stress UspA family protein|uniref:Universal stress protein n=1 Tax=Methanobacterium veterum TaxID=408577 RepID=A0A9E5A3V3_9EURY|nr:MULTISPECIES: universal stress protein [Methanobacterium]MCZ3364944.1 universal stress protein [Methanobacterium veterum]MCZ3372699.1 universal stress protein [Methanobacterium veterum]
MYRKILLATDNSEQAEKAGEHAISMAGSNSADIIVLYVIDAYYKYALPQKELREQLDEQLREDGKEAVKKFKSKIEEKKCAGKCPNINLITMIKEGKPAEVILKTAEEENVDHIVMGKSGKHGIERFLLGSTAENVVRGSKIPVNVIS